MSVIHPFFRHSGRRRIPFLLISPFPESPLPPSPSCTLSAGPSCSISVPSPYSSPRFHLFSPSTLPRLARKVFLGFRSYIWRRERAICRERVEVLAAIEACWAGDSRPDPGRDESPTMLMERRQNTVTNDNHARVTRRLFQQHFLLLEIRPFS